MIINPAIKKRITKLNSEPVSMYKVYLHMLNWLPPDPFKKQKQQLRLAFPKVLEPEVNAVLEQLFEKKQAKDKDGDTQPVQGLVHSDTIDVQVSGENLRIPYRVYFNEPDPEQLASLTEVQQLILHCIYLRHHNGFIRHQHLEQLGIRYEYWVTPFVFQLLGEYVAEIIEVIYRQLDDQLLDNFQQLGKENPRYYRQTENRMVNYWSIYYKRRYPRLRSYPGYRIFQRLKTKDTGIWFMEIVEVGINDLGQFFIRPNDASSIRSTLLPQLYIGTWKLKCFMCPNPAPGHPWAGSGISLKCVNEAINATWS